MQKKRFLAFINVYPLKESALEEQLPAKGKKETLSALEEVSNLNNRYHLFLLCFQDSANLYIKI